MCIRVAGFVKLREKSKMRNLCNGAAAWTVVCHPPGIVCHRRKKCGERARKIKHELHNIGPDHGFHSALECIDQDERIISKMEVRCPVPSAAVTTSAMAATRTPSARTRVTRKVEAATAFTLAPNRLSINW